MQSENRGRYILIGKRSKEIFRITLSAFSVIFFIVSASATPVITAYKTNSAPEIDGNLNDKCWQQASYATPFVSASSNQKTLQEQTYVRLAWDDNALYVAVEAFEQMLNPQLNMLHRVFDHAKGKNWKTIWDDHVGIFLQPDLNSSKYFMFVANSGTGYYNCIGKFVDWHGEWKIKTKRLDDRYVLEAAIPLKNFKTRPSFSKSWKVNFTRARPQAGENSTWSGLKGDFHQQEAFGLMYFAASGPSLGPVLMSLSNQQCSLNGKVSGTAAKRSRLELVVNCGNKRNKRSISGAGEKKLTVDAPEISQDKGLYQAEFCFYDGNKVSIKSARYVRRIKSNSVKVFSANPKLFTRFRWNGQSQKLDNGSAALKLHSGVNKITVPNTDAKTFSRELKLFYNDVPLAAKWLPSGEKTCQALITAEPDKSALYPKLDVFYAPLASKQVMRLYAPDLPAGALSTNYCLNLDLPEGVCLLTADAPAGREPKIKKLPEAFTFKGTKLYRHELHFGVRPGPGFAMRMRWGNKDGYSLGETTATTISGKFPWRRISVEVKPLADAVTVRPLLFKPHRRGVSGTVYIDNVIFREKGSSKNLLKTGGTFEDKASENAKNIVQDAGTGSKCLKASTLMTDDNKITTLWIDRPVKGNPLPLIPVSPDKTYILEFDVRADDVRSTAPALIDVLVEMPRNMKRVDYPVFISACTEKLTTSPKKLILRPLPPLRNSRPKKAILITAYYKSEFYNPEIEKAYADNLWRSGITWLYGRAGNPVAREILSRKGKVMWAMGIHPWRLPPYVLSRWRGKTGKFRVLGFNGKYQPYVCPSWLLSEAGKPMFATFKQWIGKNLEKYPYSAANFDMEQAIVDPPTFCVCKRCLNNFKKFAGIPAANKLTPKLMLKQYKKQWVDFRCRQNAELAGRFKEIFHSLPGNIGFSVYSGNQSTRTRERYGVDWKLMRTNIDYAITGYDLDRSQLLVTRKALGQTSMLGGVMWYLQPYTDRPPAPQISLWRNRVLKQYIDSGCKGVLLWQLSTMNGGAFYATSEAAGIIARYERFFTAGKRCDEKMKVTNIPLYHCAAFVLDNKTLVVLLNFNASPVKASVVLNGMKKEVELPAYGAETIIFPDAVK